MNLEQKLSVYITRYAPSRKKLVMYISKKTYALTHDQILSQIGYDESLMIDLWMRSFIAQGRGVTYIKQKLSLKMFEKADIEEAITRYSEELMSWDEYEKVIQDTIHQHQSRGKTTLQIRINLTQKYPYFRHEIESLLESSDDSENLQKEWTKITSKYNMDDRKEREK
jgi:SOS response regulatory protein OraA/RecX